MNSANSLGSSGRFASSSALSIKPAADCSEAQENCRDMRCTACLLMPQAHAKHTTPQNTTSRPHAAQGQNMRWGTRRLRHVSGSHWDTSWGHQNGVVFCGVGVVLVLFYAVLGFAAFSGAGFFSGGGAERRGGWGGMCGAGAGKCGVRL